MASLGPNSRQAGLMDRACESPTHLIDDNASSRTVFNESALRLVDCNGSNRGTFRALSTVGKSQGGTVRGRGVSCRNERTTDTSEVTGSKSRS